MNLVFQTAPASERENQDRGDVVYSDEQVVLIVADGAADSHDCGVAAVCSKMEFDKIQAVIDKV